MAAEQDSVPHVYEALHSETVYEGQVISLRRDSVTMPGGDDSVRETVHHPGAVRLIPPQPPAALLRPEHACNSAPMSTICLIRTWSPCATTATPHRPPHAGASGSRRLPFCRRDTRG